MTPKEMCEQLAAKDAVIVAQQARIAELRTAVADCGGYSDCDAGREIAKTALATTDDLSALKAHDNELIERVANKLDAICWDGAAAGIRSMKT